jgi:23S rRNA (pseudouridine1915-N3)-methyltransferase
MTNITLLCIGKLKEKYLADGIAEYQKRLSKYAKVDLVEIEDERIPDAPSDLEMQKVLETEGKRILAKIPKDGYVITLEIEGTQMSSTELAAFIGKIGTYESSRIVFIIGGSLGLSKDVKKVARTALSFSKMTLPHQLMRIVLLEQIYRSFTILNNTAYHK